MTIVPISAGLFRFQSPVCNGCNNLLMIIIPIEIKSTVVLNIHGVYYRCIVNGISKSGAINV